MKKICLSACLVSAILLTGCASYQTTSLSALDPECVRTYPQVEGLSIGCKAYSREDCYHYLDRDVIAKGYQPIQLTFQNRTDKHYVFSVKNLSIPCINPQEVAKTVHTSTVGRIVGYSVGGLFLWPLFIPAVVDGIKSSNANTELDKDFDKKAKDSFIVAPGAFTKTLIFVPKSQYQPLFDVTLFEEETGVYKTASVSAAR
jgi:hypothetical protein